jgi:hypothetical protein
MNNDTSTHKNKALNKARYLLVDSHKQDQWWHYNNNNKKLDHESHGD